MKMEIMQHAYCNCEGGCDLRLEGKKSLFFPQFVASLVFFSFLDGKVQCKCYSTVVYYPEQSPKDFPPHLVGSEPGNSHEGFTERQVVGCPSVYLPLKVNRGNIHCPRGPLCYQQHKDSHPCSPVNPTCISNDFQKKSKRESTVVLSFPWRQIEKAFSLKSVAWFTVFSPLSICALPFSLLLFPSHCFSSPAFVSLTYHWIPSPPILWYNMKFERSTFISIKGSMQPPLWNVFGAVWINVLRRRRWVPGNSSRQNCNPIPVLQSNHLQR